MISSTEQLEDLLSAPNAADLDAVSKIEGDILILGAGGKMGPSLARRIRRACDAASPDKRVIAVSRFVGSGPREQLEAWGIRTISADLLEPGALDSLPETANVIFMAARKFGSTGNEALTWAINTFLPGRAAERFRHSAIVAFSTGNIYPLVPVLRGGCSEWSRPDPLGEYAQSALGRERMFEYASAVHGTRMTILRLNYAVELRYGVLLDIGQKVFERRPVDLSMGHVNVIWQGDANSVCLRSLPLCQSPPLILNVTGPETVSVRWVAERFGRRFGINPLLEGEEQATALLSNAALCHKLFGYPSVGVDELIERVADWIATGGETHGKPTKFEQRRGVF